MSIAPEGVVIGKEYWYYLIPDSKPLNPSSWSAEREPKSIKFNKTYDCTQIGILETNQPFGVYKIRIGYMDLYHTYNECLKDMIEGSEQQIEQHLSSIDYEKKRIIELGKLKK